MIELERAIQAGNVDEAAQLASELARRRARITITPSSPSQSPERPISVNVQIEDRCTSGVSVTLSVLSSTTIQQMKQLILGRFEFPTEVQRWIINHRLVPDHHTLAMHGARADGAVVYLYLIPMHCAVALMARKTSSESVVSRGPIAADHDVSRGPITADYDTFQGGDGDEVHPTAMTAPAAIANISEPTSYSDQEMNLISSAPASITVVVAERQPSDDSSYTGSVCSPDIRVSVQPRQDNEEERAGWTCPDCTFINLPLRPGCQICSATRPDTYVVPQDYQPTSDELSLGVEDDIQQEQLLAERQSSYNHLIEVSQQHIVQNRDRFNCQICLDVIEPMDGIVLRECLHTFCRPCLQSLIYHSSTPQVVCPYSDGTYSCSRAMQDNEIRELVDSEQYERYLMLSLQEAESRAADSYHCQTLDCPGWCTYEDDVNLYHCEMCGKDNCLTCKAIHAPRSCREYQKDLKVRSKHDIAAQKTQRKIDAMLRHRQAMRCPTCDVILMKKDGCDWVQCTMCKTDICWVTRGPRWGPLGEGDTSGGCRCGVDDKLCHPRCENCH